MSLDNQDPSPFMNLNRDVKLAILKQLEFRDYRNLARTCRKWYDIASTAPRSTKPILQFDKIVVNWDSFHTVISHRIYDENGYFDCCDNERELSVQHSFALINQIKCKSLEVDHEFLFEDEEPELEFLTKNSDKFCFDQLRFFLYNKVTLQKESLRRVFGLSKSLWIDDVIDSEAQISLENQECIKELIEENIDYEEIDCEIDMPTDLFKTVLKQVVDGKRPRMTSLFLSYNFRERSSLKMYIEQEFPSSLLSEDEDYLFVEYNICCSDLRQFEVTISTFTCSFRLCS